MKLRWTKGASTDLDRHWWFLADRSVDYADYVEARIYERATALLRFPAMGRPDGRNGSRSLSIPDIQYVIDYRIDAIEVQITAVRSTAENRKPRA